MKPGTGTVAEAVAAARARAASDLTAARAHAAAATAAAETWPLDDPELLRLRFDAALRLATLTTRSATRTPPSAACSMHWSWRAAQRVLSVASSRSPTRSA